MQKSAMTQALGSERERLNRMSRNNKNKGGGGYQNIHMTTDKNTNPYTCGQHWKFNLSKGLLEQQADCFQR